MNALNRTLVAIVLVVFGLLAQSSRAEDIDLYVSGESQLGTRPNVLIVLDNSANYANVNSVLGTKNGIAEWNALKTVLNSLVTSGAKVNVGVMLGTASGSAQGGYIRFAVRPIEQTATLISSLADFFAANDGGAQPPINQQIEKINASGPLYDDYFDDAFRYFYGKQKFGPFADNSPSDSRDRAGTPQDYRHEGTNHPAFAASFSNYAYDDAADTTYNPPGDASKGCARNFIIFIANGFPSPADSSSAWATRTNNLASTLGVSFAAADLVQLPQKLISGGSLGQDVQKNHWADELAKLMFKYGVPGKKANGDPILDDNGNPIRNSIVTYTLDVIDSPQEHDKSALLSAIAQRGGGKYFSAASTVQIEAALAAMFAEIQAVNSVFTSATLPVSVNLQGIFENQIFFGVFRPDGQSRPRWFGNLKQYEFGLQTLAGGGEALFLADSQGVAALNPNTGFITDNAVSFWTAGNSYWTFSPRGNTATPASDSPDGPLVEKGGAAQVARTFFANNTFNPTTVGQLGRNVYTCLNGCLGGSSTEKHLNNSANAFASTNGGVTALLAPPGAEFVTLAAAYVDATTKTEIEVTATATDGTHTFTQGPSVDISGASPAQFSGTHPVTAVSGATFKYQIPVSPVTPATGTVLASPATTSQFNVVSIAVTGTYDTDNKALVTVTGHGYANNDLVSISNSARSYFNVSDNIESVTANTFIIDTNAYPRPATPATTAGTSRVGTNVIANNTQIRRFGRTVVVTVSGGGSQRLDTTWGIVVNAGVTVAGAVPTAYNSATGQTFTIKAVNIDCDGAAYANGAAVISNGEKYMYCYYLVEDEGAVAKAQKILNPASVESVTRSGTTVTVRTVADHGFANGSNVTISGAVQTQYNGTFNGIVVGGNAREFTYTLTAPLVPADTTITGGSITVTPAGSTTIVSAANLVNWVRGVDLREDENANASFTDVRTTIHGDVLHSRPIAVNYGGSTGVVVYYGSNDGTLRAINGAQTGAAGYPGRERWAFVPKEFLNYTKLTRLYNNEPLVKYPTTPDSITPTPIKRDYFWDGPIGVLRTTNGDTTLLYVGVRRGGRFIYGLDASSVDDPQHLWSVSNERANGATSSAFAELGYTWSLPQPVRFKTARTSDNNVFVRNAVVFGAGYDPNENDKAAGTARIPKMGRGIYVVDAVTGDKIAFLQPPGTITPGLAATDSDGRVVYDFAADVTPVDTNADGFVDRIYAVDTGANVWRFDVDQALDDAGGETLTTDGPGVKWTAYKIARLGDVDANGGPDDRKVLFAPTVVVFRDSTLNRIVAQIFVATGDREAPLDTTINDRVYNVVDLIAEDGTGSSDYPVTEAQGVLQDLTSGNAVTAWDRSTYPKGWLFEFNREAGEKGVNAPVLTGGIVFFATNSPTTVNIESGICSNLGKARGYAVSPFTGLPAVDRNRDGILDVSDYFSEFTGGGLAPTVTSGTVRIIRADGTEEFVPFAVGTGLSITRDPDGDGDGGGGDGGGGGGGSDNTGDIAQEGSTIGTTLNIDITSGRRNRVYWNFEGDE